MTVRMSVDRNSLNFTIMAIGNAQISMKRAERAAIRAAGKFLFSEVKKSMTYTDHTLADLAALDHPYARRHGSIRLSHGSRGQHMFSGVDAVHRQSGRLSRALTGMVKASRGGGPKYEISVNQGLAPHWRYIVLGTRTMLPRDPIWSTAQGPATIRGLRLAIVRVLGKELRSQAHVRFAGPPQTLRQKMR